jgi:tetratricopeptide (TPR) repeat protein
VALARTWSSVGWSTAGVLGQAYAQSERFDEALRLFQELVGTSRQEVGEVRSSGFCQLGEIYISAGHPAEASERARQALDLARDRKQRGFEALALRLLAEVASYRGRFQPAEAEDYSRRALALAGELGMRPLMATCHLDLGRVYRRIGKHAEAQEHLATATTMFREMDMTHWLEKLEAELRERS